MTGKLNMSSVFHPSDHRNRFLMSTREKWLSALKLYSALFDNEYTPAQNAIRFCMSWPGVSVVDTGMSTPQQVIENAKASDLPKLTQTELNTIADIYNKHFQQYKPETNTVKKK